MVCKRIISFFISIVICFSVFPVCHAEYIGTTSGFWSWFFRNAVEASEGIYLLNPLLKGLGAFFSGDICKYSEDSYHYADDLLEIDPSVTDEYGRASAKAVCKYCNQVFNCYVSDFEQAYEAQVSELPATGLTSSGALIWDTYYSFTGAGSYGYHFEKYNNPQIGFAFSDSLPFVSVGDYGYSTSYSFDPEQKAILGSSDSKFFACGYQLSLPIPVSGSYRCLSSPAYSSNVLRTDGQLIVKNGSFSVGAFVHYNVGDTINIENGRSSLTFCDDKLGSCSYGTCILYFPSYEIVPDSSLDTIYTINSRPTSITGDYGIIGDNGQITKVDTTTIINETNNTYTNPCTGSTSTITEWTYDYSDRSYNVTTESGNTVTITYGDENITIQEGDTVYNVYYIVESSGEDPDAQPSLTPTPETCPHSYTSTVDREATCTFAGQITYTCSFCGYSYTESIPATGHAWDIKESVQTSYDEEGNLLQQGYTIYKCSVCGEEYKDETGTGPPGSGSGSGSVSGEDGENIWDKLGNLIGTVFGAIIDVISAVIGKILDALIALVEMIGNKLGAVVELVLSFFDNIPQLFSGFLAFLTAVFPFLPDDVMLLLTFGIAVIVFIGIIKALRR